MKTQNDVMKSYRSLSLLSSFFLLFLCLSMSTSWANHTFDQLQQLTAHRQHGGGSIKTFSPQPIEHTTPDGLSVTAQQLRSHYQLVLFYLSTCPHCQRFDPMLQAFVNQHHWPITPYTLNGQVLPAFPHSQLPSPTRIQHFFPAGNIAVPALFLVNRTNYHAYTVSMGEATSSGLVRRLNQLAPVINHYEQTHQRG